MSKKLIEYNLLCKEVLRFLSSQNTLETQDATEKVDQGQQAFN
jgi:hypothetical protein